MRTQPYQPAEKQQLTSAQEVRYSKEFKQADIVAGFHRQHARKTKR